MTDLAEAFTRLIVRRANKVTGGTVVASIRPRLSDSRFYRTAGIASVVNGPAPLNMGGCDEDVLLEDLRAVFAVHVNVAVEYLAGVR